MAINDITKDEIKSKPNTDQYRDNFDKVFPKNQWYIKTPPHDGYIKSLQNQVKVIK